MSSETSQIYESFVPVYDAIPEKWEDARPFAVEMFRKVSNGVNVREIGFYLQEELLTGGQFVPSVNSQGEFRAIFRKTINCGPLILGANTFAHGITFDSNFTLIDLWVAATNFSTPLAINMVYPQVTMDVTNININSPQAFSTAWAIIEYLKEG